MKCEKCGTVMVADTSVVYTSNPPMYLYECTKCHEKRYGLTSQINEKQ